MVKPVTDAVAGLSTRPGEISPTAGETQCRVCGRVFGDWDSEASRCPTYWIGKMACSEECVLEVTWRDYLQSQGLDYYPDPKRYDKTGRRLRAPG